MGNSRIFYSLNNLAFGAINRIVNIIFPFVVRTVFIKTIGEEYLGLNTLFSSILQVLNLADLGFSTAIVASMYKPIANNDIVQVSALIRLYKKIYRYVGFTILIVGMILTPYIDRLISGSPPEDINIYFLWILYLTNTVVSYLLFAYKVSLLNAHQRNDIPEKVGAISSILVSCIQIYVVVALKNVYLYVFLTVICTVIYNLWCAIECDRKFPQYQCKGKVDKETKNKIIRDVGALAIQKIGNTVSLSLDAIVISAALGLTTVAIYGNYFYVISAITILTTLAYGAVTASIGNSIALETVEKNYRDFKQMSFLNTWLIGWCSICFMCLFQDFMIVWMGDELLFGIGVVFSLVMRFCALQIRKVVLTYKDAAGIWQQDSLKPIVGCIVNLILNILLVRYIGVSGVAISTIVSYVFVEIPWETGVLFKVYFRKSTKEYYSQMGSLFFALFLAGGVTFLLCDLVPLNQVAAIVVKSLICIIVPNLIFAALNRNNPDYISSKMLLMKIVNIIRNKANKKI